MVSFLRKGPFGPRLVMHRVATRSESAQIWTRDHSHGNEMDTSRVDGVEAPLHFKTRRSHTCRAGIFHNIFGSGSLIGLYIMQTDANNAVMGLQPVEWQDPVRDSVLKLNLNLIWWRRWRARDASTPSS